MYVYIHTYMHVHIRAYTIGFPSKRPQQIDSIVVKISRTATHCNTPQHTATHCNTLLYTATHCNTRDFYTTCVCNVNHSYVNHDEITTKSLTPTISMEWLGLVGSFTLWVSFAKEPYKRDDILQKRLIILRNLLIEATP